MDCGAHLALAAVEKRTHLNSARNMPSVQKRLSVFIAPDLTNSLPFRILSMRHCLLVIALAITFVGCGTEQNRVLTPEPRPQKTDAELTAEMMQGTLESRKSHETQKP